MESGGNALKTGRVTGAFVQCPKLCPNISRIAEIESQPFSGRDSFSVIRGGKPPNNEQFQQLLKCFNKKVHSDFSLNTVETLRLDKNPPESKEL